MNYVSTRYINPVNKQRFPSFNLQTYLLIGHCMIPPEEACGHEVGHHHVDGVVIMSQQDAEDTDGTQAPADPVIPPEPPWRICTKKKSV